MSKHTPGPLVTDGHSVRYRGGNIYAVADTTEAAKQIAAWPELYEALRSVLASWDQAPEDVEDVREIIDDGWVADARAALAKVEEVEA